MTSLDCRQSSATEQCYRAVGEGLSNIHDAGLYGLDLDREKQFTGTPTVLRLLAYLTTYITTSILWASHDWSARRTVREEPRDVDPEEEPGDVDPELV